MKHHKGINKPELIKRMKQLKIFEKDIKESFVRSSGPGGQNINKVATCVVLHHILTGIQVKCQSARSQGLNRWKARNLLLEKIEKKIHQEQMQARQKKEKLRRQNKKRSQKSKEKILEEKKKRSLRKQTRKKIRSQDISKYL